MSIVKKSVAIIAAACARMNAPGRASAARSRGYAMLSQEHSDRGGRDFDAAFEQLALDPTISPAWVLACHLEDQGFGFIGERRSATTGAALKSCPLPPDQLAMPAQQGGRLEHELASRQIATEGGEDGTIGGEEVWSFDASPQHRDLVTEGQDLGVLLALRHAGELDQSDHQPEQ